MLLAIDTSTGTSVAVVDRDAGVLAERTVLDTRRHAEVIGSLIAQCLTESGVSVAALSGVAVGMGPGPFTGLRVGIAAARAFAFGAGKPIVPVVSHDALAFSFYGSGAPGELTVVTDARRREVYFSSYRGPDEYGLPLRTAGPSLARAEGFAVEHGERLNAESVSAAALGMLAERLSRYGRLPAANQPLYLRSPDVTMSSGPKRVSR